MSQLSANEDEPSVTAAAFSQSAQDTFHMAQCIQENQILESAFHIIRVSDAMHCICNLAFFFFANLAFFPVLEFSVNRSLAHNSSGPSLVIHYTAVPTRTFFKSALAACRVGTQSEISSCICLFSHACVIPFLESTEVFIKSKNDSILRHCSRLQKWPESITLKQKYFILPCEFILMYLALGF